MAVWNPWHGCIKYSEGCANCYVYRRDESVGRDASVVFKTNDFSLPLKRRRDGSYKLPDGETCYACMTSDFFLDTADPWRQEAWSMIRLRPGVQFIIITKRIVRLKDCLPPDWGEGYPNVKVICTIENQRQCDIRAPHFIAAPVLHKAVSSEPLLGPITYPDGLFGCIESITAGGESGENVRVCDYDWVLDIRRQCIEHGTGFWFKQTGTVFRKDGRVYRIPRGMQMQQAEKANISTL